MSTPNRDKYASIVVKTVTPDNWLELKYGGRTYLVGVRSLLDAYIMRKDEGVKNVISKRQH